MENNSSHDDKEFQPAESRAAPGAGRLQANGAGVSSAAGFELRRLRRLSALASQLRGGRDGAKALRTALRAGLELLGATEGCVATLDPGRQLVEPIVTLPPDSIWDREFLTSFLRGGTIPIPAHVALGRLRRRQRMWGVLAVRGPGVGFDWSAREALSDIAASVSEALGRIDEERIHEVRARIDCKVLEQLRPKDLFYQILHGLESLTHYDHSATLLICRGGMLEVVAEVVTWKKGKSERIGEKRPLPEALLTLLRPGVVYGFDRPGEAWEEWTRSGAAGLADLLDTHVVGEARSAAPPDRGLLCAPLATRDRVLGLLRIAALRAGSFAAYEAGLVGQFLPHASIAVQNTQRTESLELNLIQAERKHAMANLARGVAHDVNNALGAVLPLVQNLRAEVAAGQLDPVSLAEDLRQIEGSIQTSRRIFGGMLSFARSSGGHASGANVRQAIDTALAVLKGGIRRRGIEVAVVADGPFPLLPGSQGDLEQLLLNLLTNARDAMSNGGRLSITVRRSADALELLVEDTGVGILAEHLPKVFEPFFTTKPEGHGLGLAICRSIVWQLQGKLEISSTPPVGTRVNVLLPLPPGAS
jgi:signal transduction histidine kinase